MNNQSDAPDCLSPVVRFISMTLGGVCGGGTPVAIAAGEGSAFGMSLPGFMGDKAGDKSSSTRDSLRAARRILFIDDEPAIIEMAGHILAQSGYRATFFIDGNDALQYFTDHPDDFDVIVTDFRMPQISGAELASRCTAINPRIPVLLTTGVSETIPAASCREWGVTTVIAKPFSIRQLLGALEALTR